MTDPTSALYHEGDASVERLAELIERETSKLKAVMGEGSARQWQASPVPRPHFDTTERATGDRASDPTADVVMDLRRLAVRDTMERARHVLYETLLGVAGARRGLELAIERYDGEGA